MIPFCNARPLPLGRSTFAALRAKNEIYVDKTHLIYALCKEDSKIFLSRPRRFGKSLLISTFESLFKFGLRDFSGLRIEKEWADNTYVVIRLDFSLIKDFLSFDDFVKLFGEMLADAAAAASCPLRDPSDPLRSFGDLLRSAPMSSIVLLIDEYDAPLARHLDDSQLFSQVQTILSRFYATVKSFEGALRFFFMTGITKLTNTGIFSSFNNLRDISFDSAYSTLLGYTEIEIESNFVDYLNYAAGICKLEPSELLAQLRVHYNGFCFSKSADNRVYCPWSVLNFFNAPEEGFANYWYQSGGRPAVLMSFLANHSLSDPAAFAQPKKIRLSDLQSSQLCSSLQIEALLFQTGYLTIRSVSPKQIATLDYPNEEVASSMAQLYADELLGGKPYDGPAESGHEASLIEVLASGTLDEIAARFNDVFHAIDYQRYPVTDEAACRAYLQVLMMGADMVPNVEVHAAHGRSDLEVAAGERRWVFEVKFAWTEAEVPKLLAEGAAQMKARRYGETSAGQSDAELMRAVIVFSSEKRQFAAWASA